jgi:hypothetical protein
VETPKVVVHGGAAVALVIDLQRDAVQRIVPARTLHTQVSERHQHHLALTFVQLERVRHDRVPEQKWTLPKIGLLTLTTLQQSRQSAYTPAPKLTASPLRNLCSTPGTNCSHSGP